MSAFNNLAKRLVVADFSRSYCKGSGPGGNKTITKKSLEFDTSAHEKKINSSSLNNLLLTMDSKSAQIPTMKTARRAKLENSPKRPARKIFLEVLGTGAYGSPASFYIFADQMRYMFNCGEGSQRLALDHNLKLGRWDNVFVTSKQWDKIGGLPGMALTIQDIGIPVLALHGPPGLEHMFNVTSRFIILKNLHIKAADCLNNQFYEDHVMKIEYVPIYPNSVDSDESPGNGSSDWDSIELDPEDLNIDYYKPIKGFKRKMDVTVDM
ncbi:unnamed protein product [Allacma fusca]|uniref:tRNase Z endonuclease domain-containing protein n=1 Tax=Allacma fusca TaxID=39272 RepID=A0A8J2J880_9HEXA|nr:unnamed protein product [Allacma fusca]